LRCLNRQRISRYADAQQVLDALQTATVRHQTEPLPVLTVHRRYWLGPALALSSVLALSLVLMWGILQQELQSTAGVAARHGTARSAEQPHLATAAAENNAIAVSSVNEDQSKRSVKRTTASFPGTGIAKAKKTVSLAPANEKPRSLPQPAPRAPEESAAPATSAASHDQNDASEPSKSSGWLPLWEKSSKSESQPIAN
jgi:hypothetical protein